MGIWSAPGWTCKSRAAYGNADPLARTGFVLARGGIFGLLLWRNRDTVEAAAARYFTNVNVAVIMIAAFAIGAFAGTMNKSHRRALLSEHRFAIEATGPFQWQSSTFKPATIRPTKHAKQGAKAGAAPTGIYVTGRDFAIHQAFYWTNRIARGILLLVPFGWLLGWVRRQKEDYWATLQERDGDGAAEAMAADDRIRADAIGRDDWLLRYPKSAECDPEAAPQFGRRPA